MAATRYKDKDTGVVLAFGGHWVSWSHTVVAYIAFLSALIVGCTLHYRKIVQNEWFGYPQEWFPSVSATIGDRYPERSVFMLFIAITSGPRFALVGLWYLLTAKPGRVLSKAVAVAGLVRTLTCGGWTYITSTDDHDWHDILMISYLVLTIPWTVGCIALSPPNAKAIKYRKYLGGAFFGTLIPLVYFFIQHKVHRVPGAYTTYAFFEWSLILFDVAFDAVTALDFDTFEIVVRDVKGASKGVNTSDVPTVVLEKEKENATASIASAGFRLGEAIDIVAYVYHGFVFWSTLTSLGIVVWYFPLWHMGISGYEALVMATIAPALLGIKCVRSWVFKNQLLNHLLSLVALRANIVTEPAVRLFIVGFGVWMSCLSWAATLHFDSAQPARLQARVFALIAGLLMSSVVKFAWYTNNPIWPIMHADNGGWNGTGALLAVLAALRFTRQTPLQSGGVIQEKKGSALLSALGIAGVFFGLHSLLSDTSTMILWVWEGFPIRGPVSNVHAWLSVGAMTVGLVMGLTRPAFVASWTAYAVGCLGAAVLTLYHHWTGYYGGLTLAVYLTAISIPLITDAAKRNPAVTFGLGFLIYNFVVLFHVWVVAYAFVPGGPLVREHTDWIMITMMLLIGAGIYNLTFQEAKPISRPANPAVDRRRPANSSHRKYYFSVLGLLNILFLCANFRRFPSNDYTPYHAEDRLLTAGIWTIHFSLDNDMWSSEHRIRDLIKELEIDVIGLLETDLQRIIMGNRDTTQFLAEDLGMYLAPAIHATLDVYGTLVDVFVFHSGQEEDPEDRRLQTEYLSALMGDSPRPSILLSYLVTKPKQGNYNTYVSELSGMHDVDDSDWDRWCEYILYTITDTELQVAKFVVPTKERGEEGKVWIAPKMLRERRVRRRRCPRVEVSGMFKGKGVRGISIMFLMSRGIMIIEEAW
ncbi:Protein cwh43 [Collariella sp. IMI 366227]|nr:Protein cwh43 [Collariella sp. IMI 366227]